MLNLNSNVAVVAELTDFDLLFVELPSDSEPKGLHHPVDIDDYLNNYWDPADDPETVESQLDYFSGKHVDLD